MLERGRARRAQRTAFRDPLPKVGSETLQPSHVQPGDIPQPHQCSRQHSPNSNVGCPRHPLPFSLPKQTAQILRVTQKAQLQQGEQPWMDVLPSPTLSSHRAGPGDVSIPHFRGLRCAKGPGEVGGGGGHVCAPQPAFDCAELRNPLARAAAVPRRHRAPDAISPRASPRQAAAALTSQ